MAHKTTVLFLGLPVAGILFSSFAVFMISHFFGNTFYLISSALVLLMFISPQIKRRGVVLNLHSFPFLPKKIVVSNLPKTFFPEVDEIIKNNKKVIVGLPQDRMLRTAIKEYVSENYGVLEIVDSGDIVVGSEDMPPTIITVTASGHDTLNEKVNSLTDRGWKKVGLPQNFIKGLSLKIAQEMEYTPFKSIPACK